MTSVVHREAGKCSLSLSFTSFTTFRKVSHWTSDVKGSLCRPGEGSGSAGPEVQRSVVYWGKGMGPGAPGCVTSLAVPPAVDPGGRAVNIPSLV